MESRFQLSLNTSIGMSAGARLPNEKPARSRRTRRRRRDSPRHSLPRQLQRVPRESLLEKSLFTCDELAGLVAACAFVKPGRSIAKVEVKSVRKKLKDKGFARAVNRDDIINGTAEMGLDLDEHVAFCIEAMKHRAESLGLAG